MSSRPSSPDIEERSDLDGSPFRLLGVSPRARADEITAACAQARNNQAAPERRLSLALNRLLDPGQRLVCELSYPLDAAPEQVETFYSTLFEAASMPDTLATAAGFPPLSRANFIAEAAALVPLSGDLLIALINAHADVDPVAIYTLLKSVRQCAELPAPSLLRVREGIRDLMTRHFSAVLTADDLQSTAVALTKCARQTVAENDALRLETLSHVVDAYRSLSAPQRNQASQDFGVACQRLGQCTPLDLAVAEIELFEATLRLLVSLVAPLEFRSGTQDATILEALAHIKALLAQLMETHDYQAAKRVLDAAIGALAPDSLAACELLNVRNVLEKLLIRDAIAALQAQVDRTQEDPRIAVEEFARLAGDGTSHPPAGGLAYAFILAVEQTQLTAFDEQPWAIMRELALRCGTGSREVAVALATRLVELGESMSAPSSTLTSLRADLARLSPRPLPQADVANNRPSHLRKPIVWAAALPLMAGAALLTSYGMGFLPLPHQVTAMPDPDNVARAPELLPPAGHGQRLNREYVRYCKFQERRLGIVKQHIQAADDIRAYNALVSDYNSRCSDFYYQDEDINAVMLEISSNKAMLEADAQKIMSTWPWRATSKTAQPPAR